METENVLLNKLQVGIISNTLTGPHRRLVTEKLGPAGADGMFATLPFSHGPLRGEVVLLDVLSASITTGAGFSSAKRYILNAVAYLAGRGARVIAFTAAMKRPPGKDGAAVRERFPGVNFTIGDNGTMLSAHKVLDRFLSAASAKDKIVVMGAGFLGEAMIKRLLEWGSANLTVFSAQRLNLPKTVRIARSWEELGRDIKLFISCTHKNNGSVSPADFIERLAPDAIILDAAVPPGVGGEIQAILPRGVARYDIGDYFLKDLEYGFDPGLLQFPMVGFWYGCFTEAIALASLVRSGVNLSGYDFFRVTPENMALIDNALCKLRPETVFIPLINFLKGETTVINIPY